MVLEKLGESLKNTLNKISSALFVDDKLINELVKDIQKALLTSDINVKLVFELTKKIKERALKEEPPGALSKKEWLVKIVYDELVAFLGEEEIKVAVDEKVKPTQIMLVGLFGNGKTTTAAKLGKFYKKRGFKTALMSTDTWRPAAFAQLQQLGKQTEIPVFGNPKEKNPIKIYNQFKDELKEYDLIIIDTAGRDALSDELIDELKKLKDAIKPNHSWLVISADVGQAAEKQAKMFHETTNVDGVIITKMEGSARGGGALAACAVTGAKVGFIGVGEKIDDLEKFRPKNFVGKMLGMGDIEALLEKAKESITQEQAEDLGKKFLKGDFNLVDLYEQLKAVRKMGPLSKIVEMIPGFGQIKLPKELMEMQEGKLDKWKYIMNSCTKKELEDPESISGTRIERIAKGSGCSASDVRDMLKQYKNGKKMMKMVKGGSMEQMMKKMKGFKMPGMKF